MNKQWLSYLKLTFAVIVWGGSFVATKVALREVSPITVVWLRFSIGLVMLCLVVVVRHQFTIPTRRELAYFALLGFIGITFHQWLQSTGMKTSQATTTAWIVATIPIFMALLGWTFLHEKLGSIQVMGIGLAALGVFFVVTQGDFEFLSNGVVGAPGDVLVLLSAPNWAVFSVLSRWGLKNHPAIRMVFYVMAFGWLFNTILLLMGPGLSEISHLSTTGWWSIIFLGVFCSGIAYIFWYDGLQALPMAQAGAFIYLEPFVTVVVAALVLEEPLVFFSMLGGGLILMGVYLVQRESQVLENQTVPTNMD